MITLGAVVITCFLLPLGTDRLAAGGVTIRVVSWWWAAPWVWVDGARATGTEGILPDNRPWRVIAATLRKGAQIQVGTAEAMSKDVPIWHIVPAWILGVLSFLSAVLIGLQGLFLVPLGDQYWLVRPAGALTTAPFGSCALEVSPSGKHVLVPFAGQKVLFDTGAEWSALSATSATALGLTAVGPLLDGPLSPTITGFGEGEPAPFRAAALADIQVCGGRDPRHLVGVVDQVAGEEGLLGLRELQQAVLVIDLSALRLEVLADRTGLSDRFTWMTGEGLTFEGDDDVRVLGWLGDRPVRVQIDTGASGSAAHEALPVGPALPERPKVTVSSPGRGILGSFEAPLAGLEGLCVGDVCFPRLLVHHQPLDGYDVNLGLDALWGRVLVIDLVRHRLWIGPAGPVPPNVVPDTSEAIAREKVRERDAARAEKRRRSQENPEEVPSP